MYLKYCFSFLNLYALLLYVLAYQICTIYGTNETKLLFLQILFRHGDRAPLLLYPNDPNPADYWTEGLGKLTMLGKKQHLALGKHLHFMYKDFISSNPNEVVAFSSGEERCILGAQTTLASFLPPDSNYIIDENLNWQPIPVFYSPKAEDKYLYPRSYCPLASEECSSAIEYSEKQDLFKKLQNFSGSEINNCFDAAVIFDALFVEKRHNLTIPEWAESLWSEQEELAQECLFRIYSSRITQRLRAGPFLQRLIDVMLKKQAGEIPKQKVQIYSAHDVTIIAVLSALQIYQKKPTPYCATLLFELHEDMMHGGKLIRLLYLNSTTPEQGYQEAHVLKLNGCPEFCPLDYFINYTKGVIPIDWEAECQATESVTATTSVNTKFC